LSNRYKRVRFTDEVRLPFEGKEILYLVGYGIFDTSCCGARGCRYVLVKGVVAQWKAGKNDEGKAVTLLAPIKDQTLQLRVRDLIRKKEFIQQIQFA
jgi:hypothetical protein